MKVDRALKEVWEWKEEVAKDIAEMNLEQHREYDRKIMEELEKKYHIHFRRRESVRK